MAAPGCGKQSTRQRTARVAALVLTIAWTLGASPGQLAGSAVIPPPSLPSSFWGTVTIDNWPAATGAKVTAMVAGVPLAEVEVRRHDGDPVYALHVPEDDPSTPELDGGTAGAAIAFAVDGALTPQAATWTPGVNTRRDLSAVTVRLEAPAWTVDEGAGEAAATLRLGASQPQDACVAYRTTSGSASPADHLPTHGTAVVQAGELTATIALAVRDDVLDEPDESFTVALLSADRALLATPRQATVTIRDDDEPPVVHLGRSEYTVAERDGTVDIAILLSAPSGKVVQVAWSTADGSALAGADYRHASGTLIFVAGETERLVAIPLVADGVAETPETFTVTLSSAIEAWLGAPSRATVTIVDTPPLYLPMLRGP